MKKSTNHSISKTVRLLFVVAFALALTLSTGGQSARAFASPATVNLGTAAPFVILSKTGITNISPSAVTGNLGVSPIAASSITGFSMVADPSNVFSTSAQVTGKIYASNYAAPTPANLTTAVSNMQTAYTNAAGRAPNATGLYAGDLSGRTLAPGVYKWSTNVLLNTTLTLNGTSTDIWIFQISGNLTLGSGAQIVLSGGAKAANIFWQVGGGVGVNIGTTAHFEGTILAAKAIHLLTGASMNGRALSQTAVTLQKNTLVIPSSSPSPSPIFADVPFSHWANTYIERLYNAGITGGCSTNPLNYCPDALVTRAQMAIFILRGIHGSAYTPPPATGTVFTDVPLGSFAAAWIERLAAEGITGGCGSGIYCPNANISNAELAIFLLRAKHGSTYAPPAATGTVFTDVPLGSFAAAWIEQLAHEAITTGCGGGNFCPSNAVTRAEMAVLLVKTFNLP
jgi:hypothetical protein